jgi:hypothetical protein
VQKSLVFSLLLLISSAALAQDSARATLPSETAYRSPHKAQVLAMILPGAGYAYTGEYLRGYGTWVITATGLTLGPLLLGEDCSLVSWTCGSREHLTNTLYGSLLIVASACTWISTVRDAPKSAERANERHRRRELKLHPTVGVGTQGATRLNAGFAVDW